MTTIVNSPSPSQDDGGMGFLLGTILIIVFVGILLYFGIPALQRYQPGQTNQPTQSSQSNQPTQIVVPDKVNVEVKTK